MCRLGHGSCFALPCFFAESWTDVPVFSLDLGRHAVSRCRVARSLVGLTGSCRWLLTSSTRLPPRAVLVPRLQISGLSSSSSSTFVASACFKGPVVPCLPSVCVLYQGLSCTPHPVTDAPLIGNTLHLSSDSVRYLHPYLHRTTGVCINLGLWYIPIHPRGPHKSSVWKTLIVAW
jgi:hypothetical protein